MGHSSQFKCVEVVQDQRPRIEAFQRRRGDVRLDAESDGRHTLNACSLTACADDPACAESVAADGAPPVNPAQPVLTCAANPAVVIEDREALVGRVGFVALRFETYDRSASYAGGCIDEQTEWPQLCPGFDPVTPGGTVGLGNPTNFGKIICGCGLNYGGAGCDVGCPDDQLHFGGRAPAGRPGCVDGYCVSTPDETGLDGGRSGFWMCGDFTATAFTGVEPEVGAAFHAEGAVGAGPQRLQGTITVRGGIPTMGTDGATLCETTDDEGRCSGITVR